MRIVLSFQPAVKNVTCPNPDCPCRSESQTGKVAPHGFYRTRAGRRRRYRCDTCGKTFSSTKNTPYFRLQHCRSKFDEVASLSIEGVNKSAIARVKGLAWNTVHRWLERATESCRRFNENRAGAIDIVELQADEIRTFAGTKKLQIWIFAALEVCSRYWPATIVGERNSENARKLFQGVPRCSKEAGAPPPLIVTDGYTPYESVTREVYGSSLLYGQVLKTRKKDRIIKVERRQVIGSSVAFQKALRESEDSSSLNTSFPADGFKPERSQPLHVASQTTTIV